MSMERLPFEHRPRNSIANNLDKINELVDWVNQDTHLYASATGESVTVDDASSVKGLTVYGKSVQDGTPTPDAPVPVQVVEGLNLLTSGFENGNYSPSAGLPTSSSAYARSQKTAVAPSTQYTISFEKLHAASGVYLYEWDASDTFLGQTVLGSGSTTYVKTFTTKATTSFVAFSCGASSYQEQANTIKQSQLEAGTTATPYVPYGSIGIVVGDTATPIDLQGNVLASLPDGTRDELIVDSTGRVWIEKRVGVAVYDGSNDETIIQSATNQQRYNLPAMNGANQVYNCYNNVAVYRGNVSDSGMFSVANGYMYLNVGIGTVAALRTWLADNHVTVAYPLVTPQTIDLGYIDPPAIPSGSVVTISASLTPTFHLEWWVDDGITELVNDLIAYIDYKTEG